MKTALVTTSLFSALAFAVPVVAQIAGLVSFLTPDPAGLIGGCVAAGLLGSALRDYARRPTFRVRRKSAQPARPVPVATRPPGVAHPVWTYSCGSA
jgi:hypothetical protein